MEIDVKSKSPLDWGVFVTPGIPVATSDMPSRSETADVLAYIFNPHLWQA